MALPLTPSDHPDFQRNNPIKPNDEFIVMIDGDLKSAGHEKLRAVFNRHGRGRITVALQGSYWVRDIDWAIVNELRARDDVRACGPVTKAKPFHPYS